MNRWIGRSGFHEWRLIQIPQTAGAATKTRNRIRNGARKRYAVSVRRPRGARRARGPPEISLRGTARATEVSATVLLLVLRQQLVRLRRGVVQRLLRRLLLQDRLV